MQTVIVTGANGFLGRACCAAFTANGFEVRALVRDPQAARHLESIASGGLFVADLPGKIDERAFRGSISALIHCAYSTGGHSAAKALETNVTGTQEIVRLASAAEIGQVVFISSLAAHEEAASLYGKTKWELEKLFTANGHTIIRPGTIIGNGGVFQRTREMIRRLPVVPILYGDRELQTIYIDDVVAGILASVRLGLAEPLILAHPESVKMGDFYRAIARVDDVRTKFISFPGDVALAGVAVAERCGIPTPISSDNLRGIRHLRFVDPAESLRRLSLTPLSFGDSLVALAKGGSVVRNT